MLRLNNILQQAEKRIQLLQTTFTVQLNQLLATHIVPKVIVTVIDRITLMDMEAM